MKSSVLCSDKSALSAAKTITTLLRSLLLFSTPLVSTAEVVDKKLEKVFNNFSTMELIVKEAFPLKSFAYIERHFAYIGDVRGECAKNGLPRQRRKMLLKFGQMFAFLLLQSLEFALVYFFYHSFTPLEMILLGRYIEMSSLKRETYFPAIGVLALSGYFLHLLYFDRSHGLERLLVAVLVEQKWEAVFMSERTIQGQQPVCAYMRRYTMNWIALFQLFFLVIGKTAGKC